VFLTDWLIKNCDVFVAGSNANFLSKDIATEFGGRGDEVHMYPLSFSEFMTIYDGNRYDSWNEYITYGGIPLIVLAETEEQKIKLLDNLFKETYIGDIVKRNKIRHITEMEALLEVTHSMENIIYNELRIRGFSVDVGNLTIVENGKDGKPVKKQLEVDFICNKGSKKYYIQSAYMTFC